MMKETPILFSDAMVRGILDGRKTQTRRVVGRRQVEAFNEHGARAADWVMCPYGQPCDHLWVRETWCAPFLFEDRPPSEMGRAEPIAYRADGLEFSLWKPSIHMPRWASRITLEVVGVRVERVQDISEADAIAEGVWTGATKNHIAAFRLLWDSINAARGYSWTENPWIWVIDFKRIIPD